jgi:hypothetical protein
MTTPSISGEPTIRSPPPCGKPSPSFTTQKNTFGSSKSLPPASGSPFQAPSASKSQFTFVPARIPLLFHRRHPKKKHLQPIEHPRSIGPRAGVPKNRVHTTKNLQPLIIKM